MGFSASTGDLSANAAAAAFGSFGMQALINDNTALYVTDWSPFAEPRYRARFYFDPNSIVMASGNAHYIFYIYQGPSTIIGQIEFRFSTPNYQVRAALINDATTWKTSSWFTLSDAWHPIELDWRAAS